MLWKEKGVGEIVSSDGDIRVGKESLDSVFEFC